MTQFTSSKNEFDRFEDRRAYPRIALNNDAHMFLPGDRTADVTVHDISSCSLQVRFNTSTQDTIRSALQIAGGDKKHVLGVKFGLKLHEQEEELSVICTPVYICQIDQNTHAMGLKFSDLEASDQEFLNKYIEVSLEPQ